MIKYTQDLAQLNDSLIATTNLQHVFVCDIFWNEKKKTDSLFYQPLHSRVSKRLKFVLFSWVIWFWTSFDSKKGTNKHMLMILISIVSLSTAHCIEKWLKFKIWIFSLLLNLINRVQLISVSFCFSQRKHSTEFLIQSIKLLSQYAYPVWVKCDNNECFQWHFKTDA